MTTQDDLAVAVGASVDNARWRAHFDELMGRVAGRFARVESRRRARNLVLGLVSELPRKNCWSIAEHAGDATPTGMQHLLCRASWDADGVRDDLRNYVLDHLGCDEAVLVVDETGDLKKGQPYRRGAAAIHRHRGSDRKRPGRGVFDLRHRQRTRDDRPSLVLAEVLGE